MASLGTLSQQRSLSRTSLSRSRLSLALESAGSRSTAECLYPGRDSHHHLDENSRLSHTSSLASLYSISGPALNTRADPQQIADREMRRARLSTKGARQAKREESMQRLVDDVDRRLEQVELARSRNKAEHARKVGQKQLLEVTRGMENGLMPVRLESAPTPKWVPVPPHLSSHWKTISGQMEDPPARAQAHGPQGRRSFPEPAHAHPLRLGVPVWGGSHQQ